MIASNEVKSDTGWPRSSKEQMNGLFWILISADGEVGLVDKEFASIVWLVEKNELMNHGELKIF